VTLPSRYLLCLSLVSFISSWNSSLHADESNERKSFVSSDQSSARWFHEVSVGFRTGGCFLSTPTNGFEFTRGVAVGEEINWGIFVRGPHRARLSVGFLKYSVQREKGTYEVRVKTRYSRLDFTAGYDFTWRVLVVGVDVGAAMAVNTVVTMYDQPEWEISGDGIAYQNSRNPEIKRRIGVNGGFLAGLSFGTDLGELFGVPDLLEIRVKTDYTTRSGRNEIVILAAIEFWPTAMW
jgi:hypothetical protein